ncbi:MAG TPA: ferrochelatase [Polyangiaceae bacterium]|nr:ferrochelatase [Polyangiaceae bacterium]
MTWPADTGVLLVAHGTVEDLDDLGAFVSKIRHGRPPPPGLVEDLRRRYEAIGGSPLLRITHQQSQALAKRLEVPVLTAMRLWEPGVERALAGAEALGLSRLVVIALAPFSQHVYWDAARKSADATQSPVQLVQSDAWGEEPDFVAAQAELIREHAPQGAALVISAHSLPKSVIDRGDPYARLVERSASAISAALGQKLRLCYQSQGKEGGDWLGPSVEATLTGLAAEGQKVVAWAPVGFIADHVETLYDLDIEARSMAERLGLTLTRIPALNLHPGLVAALSAVAIRAVSS